MQNFVYFQRELKHWSPWQGIRAMHKRVRDVRGIRPCYRNDVGVIMAELDASGLIKRCPGKKKIERRKYFSHGPNHIWHIDGNDKLKFFGVWVHLGIDGFSRKIIWLKAGTSNRKQSFIARYFYDAVREHGGCPRIVRADRGTENLIVGQMQVAFHFRQATDQGRDSFRVGKSVHNQRAEFFNSMLKKTWIKKWQVTFETMMESGILDLDNPVHINCLQHTHLPLLQRDLTLEQRLWNTHDIRKQKNVAGPFGKPDILFTSPPQGFGDMLCTVDDDLLQYAEQFVCAADEPLLVANEAFKTISGAILRDTSFPSSPDGSLAAYLMLVEKFTTCLERRDIPIPSTFAEANQIYELLANERL
ncbi:hypothetical protein E1301_Tti023618 [Triplophysa tibetana]|uniref:Integrase core domain-containing protein n=1 Tax=Triplophysa tibetana TaxID=1572043 RepID=A0A5A9PKH3_9TELE|nr:hypothetical protein E1301_Tti018134 [Triplophysa tibetana]KAA0721624.1 hypothetical protein E1301_Tti023618 [Triplophysa tibetana]